MRLVMVMVLAAWTAAGQVFPPPPTGGAQGGSGGEAMPPAPGPLYGAVRAAGTVRAGDAVVWGDAQGRTITGVDMENSAWASTGMVAAAVAEATAGMATTQQVAAVVGPLQSRIGNIEQNTNRWDLAHSWGNHAEAGYFLASDIVNYYTRSQTDQEISSAIDAVVFPVTSVNGKTGDVVVATDRIATLDGDRWIDATGSVWLVGPTAVTNWFYTDSISPATTSVLDGLSFPLPPEFYIETPHGYISGTSEPPYAPIHTEIWLGEDIGALWGTASATDGIYATDWFGWSRLFSREVMTIKTQRVDRVALQSELKNTIYARPEADGKHSLWIREETP